MKRIAALLFVGGCAHSTVTPAAPAAKPVALAPELAPVAFYVGDWTCEGAAYDASGAVTEKYDALTIHVAPAIARWLSVTVSDHGEAITSELKGVDAQGHFHHLWTANDGTAGSLTSPGWTNNQLVFDEDHPAPESRTRMTFTKVDDTHFTHEAAVDTGAGYVREFLKTCRKT